MKMTYRAPKVLAIVINDSKAIMSASLGGDTGYYPGGIIEGGELTDED